MISPRHRVVLVSGANRGIGRAVAEKLLAEGYRVSLGVRDAASVTDLVNGPAAERVHVGIYIAETRATHEAWVASAFARWGRIDGLVNNAGISSRGTLRDIAEAELDRVWAVNCKAPLSMIQLGLPHLEASGQGRIVNIASLSGKRVKNDHVAYAMSKFALMALTHAARRISWDKGVRATALCPPFVRTDMTADVTNVARADMADPRDIAELAAMLIALPNTASIAELLVNMRLEDMV
jgi:NAD(P)-dependent dehydrogenase (short-subunit alcohol dehydrogenase family)